MYASLCDDDDDGAALAFPIILERKTCPSKTARCMRLRCHACSTPFRFQGVRPGRSHWISASFEKHWLIVRATAAICFASTRIRLVRSFQV